MGLGSSVRFCVARGVSVGSGSLSGLDVRAGSRVGSDVRAGAVRVGVWVGVGVLVLVGLGVCVGCGVRVGREVASIFVAVGVGVDVGNPASTVGTGVIRLFTTPSKRPLVLLPSYSSWIASWIRFIFTTGIKAPCASAL